MARSSRVDYTSQINPREVLRDVDVTDIHGRRIRIAENRAVVGTVGIGNRHDTRASATWRAPVSRGPRVKR